MGSGAGQGPALMHHGLADSARRSELRLVPRLRVAGGQLVAAAALPALGATGHVGQGVRADEISVGRAEGPGIMLCPGGQAGHPRGCAVPVHVVKGRCLRLPGDAVLTRYRWAPAACRAGG